MKNKTNIPNLYFSLIFSSLEKQIKMNPFGLKTLLKTCIKTLEKMKILALKILLENQLKYEVYIAPYEICPLAAGKGKFAPPVDRPTIKFLTVEPPGRPPGRPGLDPESNGSLVG